MKPVLLLLAVSGLGLAACSSAPDPDMIASGGAAGDFGPEYCSTMPEDPAKREQWAELCNESSR